MKLWQKKYQLDKQVEKFTVGDDFIIDKKILKYDCLASIVHAKMLAKSNIIKKTEAQKLSKELKNIIELDKKGKFVIELEDEDCHTAIENHLIKKLGDVGKKIHTARSRNDQALTALRLYYKNELKLIVGCTSSLAEAIKKFSKENKDTKMPGFTHTRKAMPSSVSLWANSFIDSFEDNKKLLDLCFELIDQSPLGSAAGYGVPIDIDKDFTAVELGFTKVQENSIYVQNSRGKFESTILHTLSQMMFDLNKISTDLILFSMTEFSYFELPKEFCSGSSIMPHKKNPDILELIRAKYHIVVSNELKLKSMTSNLISGYNRDLQLTKKPVMESFDITNQSLSMMEEIFSKLLVNRDSCSKAMTSDLYATDEVYKMVKQGTPFREAYRVVAEKYD